MMKLIFLLFLLLLIYIVTATAEVEKFKNQLPNVIIFFRHCEKETEVCGEKTFPNCCITEHIPPFSCDDCSTKGYLRAQGLYDSINKLLGEDKLTAIYAAGSTEMKSSCSRSRRMWELVVPMASKMGFPINTNFCSDQKREAAKHIIKNNPGGYVAVAWENDALPDLINWTSAFSKNYKSKIMDNIAPKWNSNVFDQYWILDLRNGYPQFFIEPQNILPGDCNKARDENGFC